MGVTFLVAGNMGGRGPLKTGPFLVGEPPGDALAEDLLTLPGPGSRVCATFLLAGRGTEPPGLRNADGGDPTSRAIPWGMSYPARPAAAT